MSLADMMADHVARFVSRSDHFAQTVVMRTARGTVDSDPIKGIFGQTQEQISLQPLGTSAQRTETLTLSRSQARAAMATAAASSERDPQVDDRVIVASGAYVGTWRVTLAIPDEGDAITLTIVQRASVELGGGRGGS